MFKKSLITPFGGPAGGLWPAGLRPRPVRVPGNAAPSCDTASIFADCFGACSGIINAGSRGPVCGWTFSDPYGPLGGEIVLSAGSMSFNTTANTQYPAARKALLATLADILNISGKMSFTEYPTAPNGDTTYQFFITNAALTRTVSVSLFGDGSAAMQVGDIGGCPFYQGTWTPNGGSHEVYFGVDATGLPVLYLDGVEIALTLLGNIPTFAGSLIADSITVFFASAAAGAASSVVSELFVTQGPSAVGREFCCPA